MVLESLTDPIQAEKRPRTLILLGIIITTLAIIFADAIFPLHASIVFVFFVVMASIPIMIGIIRTEEKKDLQDFHEYALLKEHSKALIAFIALFVGVLFGVVLWYVFPGAAIVISLILAAWLFRKEFKKEKLMYLIISAIVVIGVSALLWNVYPADQVNTTFSSQIQTLNSINAPTDSVTGQAVADNSSFNHFTEIFFNNIKVLIFCILFSFLYGAGAIFILSWNASVIGVAMGNYIRSQFAQVASWLGFTQVAGYIHVVSCGLLRYTIHGVPEILSYFVGALAGGIISIAVIRHDFKGKKFEHIVLDSSDLLLISLGILLLAAILEVWVTPYIFTSICQIG